jgi:hypothetical protein
MQGMLQMALNATLLAEKEYTLALTAPVPRLSFGILGPRTQSAACVSASIMMQKLEHIAITGAVLPVVKGCILPKRPNA